jgi:hypothetical protein
MVTSSWYQVNPSHEIHIKITHLKYIFYNETKHAQKLVKKNKSYTYV